MPYEEECAEYLGKRLFVLPYYGHGWGFEDGTLNSHPADSIGPEPFNLVVTELVYRQSQIVGAIGKVQEPQHKYDGMWAAFCQRLVGDFNFTSAPGQCLIWIGRDKPIAKADSSSAVYYWIEQDATPPKLVGFGVVATSKEWIKELYERTMETRKNKIE